MTLNITESGIERTDKDNFFDRVLLFPGEAQKGNPVITERG